MVECANDKVMQDENCCVVCAGHFQCSGIFKMVWHACVVVMGGVDAALSGNEAELGCGV